MAVEVIFTMASRGLRICGSGTVSTRMSCLPYQQVALICSTFLERCLIVKVNYFGSDSNEVIVFTGGAFRPAGRLSFCPGDFAGFDQLFEAVEFDVDLFLGIFT